MSAVIRGNEVSSREVVPFYGRSGIVTKSNPLYHATMKKITKINENIVSIANSNGQRSWKELQCDLNTMTTYLTDPNRPLFRYQVELINEGLLPYLGGLKGRMHIDDARFKQINKIVISIINSENDHPAILLQTIDEVIYGIKQNSGLQIWKSELLTALESASSKQWQSIIADNKRLLHSYGGKLIALGLVGVIGWPVAFFYPLYKLAITLMAIIKEWERSKQLTRQSLFELLKTIAIIIASNQVLSILAVYASLGYTCLLMGGAAVVIASSNGLIKTVAPVLAPHLSQLDRLMDTISSTDFVALLSQPAGQQPLQGNGTGSRDVHQQHGCSDRVEELPPQPSAGSSATQNTRSSGRGENISQATVPAATAATTAAVSAIVRISEEVDLSAWNDDGSDAFADYPTAEAYPVGVRKRFGTL